MFTFSAIGEKIFKINYNPVLYNKESINIKSKSTNFSVESIPK